MSKSNKKSCIEIGPACDTVRLRVSVSDLENKDEPTGIVRISTQNNPTDHVSNLTMKKVLSEGATHSSQESLAMAASDPPMGSNSNHGNRDSSSTQHSTNAHVHTNSKEKENMSCIASSPANGVVDTGHSQTANTGTIPADTLEDTTQRDSSRECSPEGHTEVNSSRSNAHSSAESRSSDAESSKRGAARPVNMDLEKMKVSLILKDDDYDLDDLCITSSRTAPADVPARDPTPPGGAPSDLDLSLDWGRGGPEQAYTGVGFREGGRRTPTNSGQLSDSSSRLSLDSTSPTGSSRTSAKAGTLSDKKKKPYWYNVLSPTYKSRSEDFKRIFKDIPADERLIVDYSCALQKDILVHGRIYITQNWICFYANIFRWETVLMLKCKEITSMTKEKTARVIPNAIQICTKDDKYFFTSFGTRDKTYLMLFRVWQNALTDNVMTTQELWQWVRYSYGEELGLNSSDEDYVQPSTEDELQFQTRALQDEKMEVEAVGLGDIKNQDTEDSAQAICNGSHCNKSDGERDLDKTEGLQGSPQKACVTITNGDLLTDQGDTTEDDQDEVLCSGHDHLDIAVVDEVFNSSVDKMFEMIFTDSQVYRHFTEVKKTTELVQSQWSEEVDGDGDRHRTISYTLSLNYSIGPKTSPATEKQVLRAASNPGSFYLVDTECINSSVPYGENFYVINRYCLARVTANKCRLKITSAIKYRKSVWGLVKSFIEKNVTNGILDSFTCMANLIRQESARFSAQSSLAPPTGRKKVLRRRRNVSDRTQTTKRQTTDNLTGHTPTTPVKHHPSKTNKGFGSKLKEENEQKFTADVLIRVVCVVLIILAVFNGLLFYKLWSLEQKATLLTYRSTTWTNSADLPGTSAEWVRVLAQQQTLHDAELQRWRDVLASSSRLLDGMQRTLASLEQSIARYTAASTGHDEL